MTVRIACRVQHHPARKKLLAEIQKGLAPLPTEVSTDRGKDLASPWRGYLKCLTDPPDCTHLLIVQDDIHLCNNFAAAVEQIAAANMDVPVALFLGGLPKLTTRAALEAAKHKHHYAMVHYRDFCPVVAILWPLEHAKALKAWADENPRPVGMGEPRSDDAMVGKWMRASKQTILVTIPSLVQHPDIVASTVGRRARAGMDKGRVAFLYIGEKDPLEVDWSHATFTDVRGKSYPRPGSASA